MKRENRKTHCFIDYENVHESGFEGVEALSDGDAVTIFISSVSHKISLVVLETLIRKKCELNIIHTIGTGKNNLDFQLIAEVGYQIGRHTFEAQSTQFAIISKDRGYENVVTAFLNRGFQIIQCETIQKIKQNVEETVFESVEDALDPEWEFAASIRKCLLSLKMSESDLKKVDAIFKESLSLNVFHDRLVKAYGKKGNHPIYGKLKSLHKQYQKTLPSIEPEFCEEMPETILSHVPAQEIALKKRTEEEIKSLEVFWDQLLEESGSGDLMPVEELSEAGELEADTAEAQPQPEKPAAEVKKKTRGRKRKQPVSKPKAEPESIQVVSPESAAAHEAEPKILSEPEMKGASIPQRKLESGSLSDQILDETFAELPEKQPEKKKRRPGRPRKKNGTTKPAEPLNEEDDAEATKREGTKSTEIE